jgi:hypothetical protein
MWCSDNTTNLVVFMKTRADSADWFDNLSIKQVTNGDVRAAFNGYFGGTLYGGTVRAGTFYGNAAGLTGLVSAVTAGVNQITVGASNITGNIVLAGSLVDVAGASITTVTVQRADYLSFQFSAPTNDYYQYSYAMPRNETSTMSKVWAQTDHGTATFSIVYAPWTQLYSVCYTNLNNVQATVTGNWYTSGWTDSVLPPSNRVGVKVLTVGATCTNLSVGVRVTY